MLEQYVSSWFEARSRYVGKDWGCTQVARLEGEYTDGQWWVSLTVGFHPLCFRTAELVLDVAFF